MSDSSAKRSRKRWWLYFVVALSLGTATWYFALRAPAARKRQLQPAWAGSGYPPLIPVRTVIAKSQPLAVHVKAIGTVTAFNTVTVKSRVDGQLIRVGFEEGQRVERGQVLAELDAAPYRIRLSVAEGQLQQSQAQLDTARSDLERTKSLHDQNLVTNQQLDVQQALVAQRQGAVAATQAQVDDARLQLAYTHVEAPIAGRVGLRAVDVGNLVRQSDANGIATITQTRPISVVFTIPEVELAKVLGPFRAGESLTVDALDRSESAVLASGVLKTLDNQIDIATGTLRLKAEFANDDERLFPNQFVNVRMHVRTLDHAIVIPSAAVQFGSRGTYVYVVDAQKKARIHDVVLGPNDGSLQAVTSGLKDGDAVVLEGLDRLREGRGVVIANEKGPAVASEPAAAP